MTDWTKPAAYLAGLDNVKTPPPIYKARVPFDPSRPLRMLLWPPSYRNPKQSPNRG